MVRSLPFIRKYGSVLLCIIVIVIILGSIPVDAENPANSSFDQILIQNLSGSDFPDISSIPSGSIQSETPLNSTIIGTESILSAGTSGTDQDAAAIWQDKVVWQSIFSDGANGEIQFSDLFLYNISTGMFTRIGSNLSVFSLPDVWEDRVVWSMPADENYEIFLYNSSTNETLRVTNDPENQLYPRIWGDTIAWQTGFDTDPETAVYLYNLTTGSLTQLDAGSGFAASPSIWEDRVVWQDGRNGNDYDIYLYNCTSGIETQITVDPAMQTNPSIWNDFVVWEDSRESIVQIYFYDLASGNESQITFGTYDQLNPSIFENYVVYVNQSAICLLDLATMGTIRLSTDDSDAYRNNPDIWGNRIVWTDRRYDDLDIVLFTLGVEVPPLLADFSQNATEGESPLTVAFFDSTTGQVDGRHWDFGDGTSSDEQNPVHIYETPGSYTVSLTVHNPWQRDGVVKEELIFVGSVPIPHYSVNKTNGPSPLAVQFTDESTGIPGEWNWDFGDGGISGEQNPVHVYDNPGIYQVSLVVSNRYGNATLTKEQLITVKDGIYQTALLPSEGIRINYSEAGPVLELNRSLAGTCTISPATSPELISCIPKNASGIAQLLFSPKNGTEFSYSDNDTITGILGNVSIVSSDLVLGNFSQSDLNKSRFNYTFTMNDYPSDGKIQLVVWEGSTPEELERCNDISMNQGYVRVEHLAYTAQFNKENILDTGSAIVIFGISSDWIDQFGWRWSNSIESDPPGTAVYIDDKYVGLTPIAIEDGFSPGNHTLTLKKSGYWSNVTTISVDDKRNHIHVIRIGDDGSGDVLKTTFIGHDSGQNVDYFMAESPNGLSTFGLASLSRSGSVFQMLYLTISGAVQNSRSGGGGGGGGGGSTYSGVAGAGTTATPVATQTPEPTLTPRSTITGITSSPTAPPPTVTDTIPTTQETVILPNNTGQASPPVPGTLMILLRNLAVVAVVAIVTVIFYFRWKKQ